MKKFTNKEAFMNYAKEEMAKTKEQLEKIDAKSDEPIKKIEEQIKENCDKIRTLGKFEDMMKVVKENEKLLDKTSRIINRDRKQKDKIIDRSFRRICRTVGVKASDIKRIKKIIDSTGIDLADLGLG